MHALDNGAYMNDKNDSFAKLSLHIFLHFKHYCNIIVNSMVACSEIKKEVCRENCGSSLGILLDVKNCKLPSEGQQYLEGISTSSTD